MNPMHFTPRDGKQAPWWALLLGIVLTGAATLFGGYGVWNTAVASMIAWRSQDWPTTSAVIESVELEEYIARRQKRRRLVVRYRYVVEGDTYFGSKLAPLGPSNERAMFDFLAEQQRKESPVRCYYDPSNPRQAFLYRRLSINSLAKGLIVFGAFLFVGGLMLRGILRAAWRRRPVAA